MLPHLTPRRSKCSAVVYVDCAALERLPDFLAPAVAWSRAFTVIHEACIIVNQTNQMPLHILLVATGLSGQAHRRTDCPKRHPGLSAPQRKARSQKQVVCPRKLREPSCFSLRASRLAAACRLRQSCRRDRGPVALPRSGLSRLPQPPSRRIAPLGPFAPQGAGPTLFMLRAT